jgi:hypothetical protein
MRILALLVLCGIARAQTPAIAAATPTVGELGTGCTAGPTYDGSFHAEAIFHSAWDKPKAQIHLSYRCGETSVALYLLDFGTESAMEPHISFYGGRLWGGQGPTVENPDEILSKGSLIAIISAARPGAMRVILEKKGMKRYVTSGLYGSVGDASAPTADIPEATVRLLEKILTDTKGAKMYADAVTRFAAGSAQPLAPLRVPGVAVRVDVNEKGERLRVAEELAFLALSADGADYGALRPQNQAQEQGAEAYLDAIHKGQPPPASAIAALETTVSTMQIPLHPASVVGRSTVYGHSSRVFIRRAAAGIVCIETFNSGRLFYVAMFATK